jgi:hypothetical protein
MKKINNKGAALVSVMIAITFISIVATTLLVISLNNYQMKVVDLQSKSNFYETEQRINVVTTQLRDVIPGTTDVNGSIGNLVNGGSGVDYSGASFAYNADKIAALAFPGESVSGSSSSATVTYDGDTFTFYPGTVTVTQKTNGKQITINDVTVKQVANDNKGGYENTIKTDINFYVEIAQGGGASGGVGSCAFLLDSNIRIDAGDKASRLNITGNTIMGQYTYVSSGSYTTTFKNGAELATPQTINQYSVPTYMSKTKSGDTVSKVTRDNTNYQKAIIYLNDTSFMNFNSDNNVILGDIFLKDKSVLNILDGSFTVYGDIFVADNAAFVCNGDLKLGYNSNIYKVDGSGNCTKVSTSDKTKNIIFTSLTKLDQKNYDKIADHLKLFDNISTNDGVIVNILKKHPTLNKYCYQAADAYQTKSDKLCTFDGIDYYAVYPAGDLNQNYANELIFVNDKVNNGYVKVVSNVPNSTIISRKNVYAYDTHNICVSKMGDRAFNYILSNASCKIKFKPDGGNETTVSIKDFFDANCNTFVTTVFNLGSGTTGATPVPTRTAVGFSDWTKE